MYLKGFLVAIVVLFLSGCASFIADRITTKLDATPSNDIPAWVVSQSLPLGEQEIARIATHR